MYPMGNDRLFMEWLIDEISNRGWSQADLAKHAGMNRQAVNKLINGERNPGPDSCQAIALAFKLPPEFVFRKAGLLPHSNNIDERVERINHKISQLPQDDQERIEAFVNTLLAMRGENETSSLQTNHT